MPYDAAATRSRLITAAVREFSAFGLAGARVDRIAEEADANKRAIYDYFGNKEGLFAAALARVTADLIEAVPLREDDLGGYAGSLFDYLQQHAEAVRMLSWRRLERPQSDPAITRSFVEHVAAVRDQPGDGHHQHGINPIDLVVLTIGLANAWQLSGPDLLASYGQNPSDPELVARHRAAVIEAVRRISPG